MCGIIGYVGDEAAAPFLVKALKNLEYRGYDSAGIATICNGKVCAEKDVGKLEQVCGTHDLHGLPGNVGIGHVRWATHGDVTQANAHPHFDCKRQIAVVHNGIVENYQDLRTALECNHRFVSQTDTEVIPHLIEEYMDAGASLEQAVLQASKQLKGCYAFAAVSVKEPDKIVATRRESPLVVGSNAHRSFIASDALAFLEETNRVVFLEDGELVVLSKDITFLDNDGKPVKKDFKEVDWKWDQATKQGYDYFMMKEILEEPQAIRRATMQDRKLLLEMAIGILRSKQVVITACGTSRFAALVGRYLFSRLAGKFCDVIMASEFQYFSDSVDRNTLVIAVSQSGETADVIQGVKRAKENGATVYSMVNTVGSSLARMSDSVLYLNCGPEIGVAATKTFVSQLALFYLLSFTMANKLDDGLHDLLAICPKIEENVTKNNKKLQILAQKTRDKNDFYYIARGINFAIALEGALKMKEISYVHAEGMPAGELKHGTLALIERGTPVVVVCPNDYTYEETIANAHETKARGAFVIGLSEETHPIFDDWVVIPDVDEIFQPLVTVVPLQLLAYYSALTRGRDPDKPRNLAKSVTVK
ncbi:MAG: glutamine--fructose-6-phosphate transaminase (isomerizing) [Dehalococcoidia bacterium]|nr:glutamine--fructose-6-phosphate transaminase (isomerizing) [Dehalococcoidia bacterium]